MADKSAWLVGLQPWKLPAPFVGPVMQSAFAAHLVGGLATVYPLLKICGSASTSIYLTNLIWVLLIQLLLIRMAASRRGRDDTHDESYGLLALVVLLSWTSLLILNTIILVSLFLRCHVGRFQRGELSFCYLFGNSESAGHKQGSLQAWAALVVTWGVLAFMLMVFACQIANWAACYDWAMRQAKARDGSKRPLHT